MEAINSTHIIKVDWIDATKNEVIAVLPFLYEGEKTMRIGDKQYSSLKREDHIHDGKGVIRKLFVDKKRSK